VGFAVSIADFANATILISFAIRLLGKEINNASWATDTHHRAETSITNTNGAKGVAAIGRSSKSGRCY
jgi:hypothetical protein